MADPLAKWVEEMKDCIDWDPTPHYLYDNSGGEPVLSARELYHKAFREHKEAHS